MIDHVNRPRESTNRTSRTTTTTTTTVRCMCSVNREDPSVADSDTPTRFDLTSVHVGWLALCFVACSKNRHHWFNEHLQPTTYRLSAWAADPDPTAASSGGAPVAQSTHVRGTTQFDFIGALESFADDWLITVSKFSNISADEHHMLTNDLDHSQSNTRADNGGTESRATTLSAAGVQRLCQSPLYRDEWRCLGYPSPCL
jgi:hypothetical protein